MLLFFYSTPQKSIDETIGKLQKFWTKIRNCLILPKKLERGKNMEIKTEWTVAN
jgi:hypothetical protein